MSQKRVGRREFLAGAGVVGAATLQPLASVTDAVAQTNAAKPAATKPAAAKPVAPVAAEPVGYIWLKPNEVAFVEALVDHMIPKDELTGSGTEIGIATYIDRALASSWGKGDRLYRQGPWAKGTPNQGYQLPLTPAELYSVGVRGSDAYCVKTFGQSFARCSAEQKETFLKDLSAGKITLDGGVPGREFFSMFFENVREGLFADPIYGGNKDKIGWKMIGHPGVAANHAEDVKKYNNGERFPANPVSIADLS
jgi:gluconate 2-dehydrogenase gamma chain